MSNAAIAAAKIIKSPPTSVRVSKTAAPSAMALRLPKATSDSITTEVVLERSLDAPYCNDTLPSKNAIARPPASHTQLFEMAGIALTQPCAMPAVPASIASVAPPLNIASMRDSLGALFNFFSKTLVNAKQKPPINAKLSAKLR